MRRFPGAALLLALIFALSPLSPLLSARAQAAEARDLTAQCSFRTSKSRYSYKLLYDGNYEYAWETERKKNVYLEVRLPEGERCSGVQIKWGKPNAFWQIESWDGEGWTPCAQGRSDYLTTFTELPGVTVFRIAAHQRVADKLLIHELNVLSEGERPAWVQVWEPTVQKADLLLVVAHPDDEYIFMGGIVPYYAGELKKRVLVAYITESTAERRTELLDGLWQTGLRNYPLTGRFYDRYTTDLAVAYKRLGKEKTQRYMAELFRQYRPEVVVTHDVEGEYGHAVHKLCADIVLNALRSSADASRYPESAQAFGVWDVPKAYLHLYPENRITMNWHVPLAAFGGKTAFEMAEAGFACHLSQQKTKYLVYDDGPYDSKQFGLVRSLVGPDEAKDDFFENLEEEAHSWETMDE